MPKKSSTSKLLQCACVCEQPVKPGQRWGEPACKARVYRERKRAQLREQTVRAAGELLARARQIAELTRRNEGLERA